MNDLQKLYDVLVRDGYYTKSFDEFKVKWQDQTYQDKVYGVVSRDGLFTKSKDEFLSKYSGQQEQLKNNLDKLFPIFLMRPLFDRKEKVEKVAKIGRSTLVIRSFSILTSINHSLLII
jgi:hypothetical protein